MNWLPQQNTWQPRIKLLLRQQSWKNCSTLTSTNSLPWRLKSKRENEWFLSANFPVTYFLCAAKVVNLWTRRKVFYLNASISRLWVFLASMIFQCRTAFLDMCLKSLAWWWKRMMGWWLTHRPWSINLFRPQISLVLIWATKVVDWIVSFMKKWE